MSLDSSAQAANADPASPESELLLEYREDGVAVVRMNRPKATNALSLNLQALLSAAFTELAANPQVRAIVLTGGEKVFPEEVEEALRTHPAIFDAVVAGRPACDRWHLGPALVRAGGALDPRRAIGGRRVPPPPPPTSRWLC